ncbi:MAG: nucleotide exchange factor GrpE [Candidatus Micrarchaeota archaeon]|nr:nucleotide exchange factor GrpE [Candidatus Micrarchaeota archaeon]
MTEDIKEEPEAEAAAGKEETAAEAEPQKEKPKEEDGKEQMLRLMAEFDNYKKRVKGEISGAKDMGRAEVMLHMLPIVDEFDLAVAAMAKSEDKEALKGLEMLYSNLVSVLKKEGLAEMPVEGKFDPYKHEIILVRESDKKEGTILEVVKKGYTFNGTMLRPASVIIAKAAEAKQDDKNNDA